MATKGQSHIRLPAVGPDTEQDRVLTAFLTAQIAPLLSESHELRPRCPRCGSRRRCHVSGVCSQGAGARPACFMRQTDSG
ncbi:putative DNA-binding domain protein [Burkholderia pseudomallei MSHR7343]|nr:putative DNA-binding domain protein [Burkholderia pseudomallei MSHR7343]